LIFKTCKKKLLKIPKPHRKRIAAAIDGLAVNPFAGKKLYGELLGTFSLRIWPYRIIYQINKQQIIITILDIGHRQGIYN